MLAWQDIARHQCWTQHAAIACRHFRCCCTILAHVLPSLKSVKLFIQHLLSFLSFSQSMKRAATFVCMIRATLFGLRVRTDTGSNQPRPQGHPRVRPDKRPGYRLQNVQDSCTFPLLVSWEGSTWVSNMAVCGFLHSLCSFDNVRIFQKPFVWR